MRRGWVSVGIVLGVVISLLPAYASAASAQDVARPDTGVGSITWGPCTDGTLIAFGAECGMLSVPLDYPRPSGAKIQLAVSRVGHTVPDEDYQGIMLVNPGGPGGSGLIYSVLGAFVPGDVGSTYDWIGFDPRGVGDSVPALSCDPNYTAGPRPPYDPATVRIEFAWLVKSAKYAIDCARSGGLLLGHLKTTDTVADMDAIRQSLGAEKMNFYGFSYGTYLGQVYATLHPDLVRRMVLDSNVDPRTVWYQANLDQDPAFEITVNKFFDWVALHDDVYGLGTTGADVQAKYYAALASLAANPQGQLGASEWADAFLGAGYVQFLWPDTATAFTAFVNNGDPGPATDLYLGQDTPGDDNAYAMYLATECTDDALAAELVDVALRQHPRCAHCALPHVGERLVQRSVRVLVRGVRPTGQRRWGRGTADPAPRRDARRGHPVPRQPRGAPALPSRVAHRHCRRREPRQQPVRRGPLRGQRRGRLPRRRHAAGAAPRQQRRRRVRAGCRPRAQCGGRGQRASQCAGRHGDHHSGPAPAVASDAAVTPGSVVRARQEGVGHDRLDHSRAPLLRSGEGL